MKKLCILTFLYFLLNNLYAKDYSPYIYADCGLGVSNKIMAKIGVDIMYRKHFFSLCYYGCASNTKNVPTGYHAGTDIIALIPPSTVPKKNLHILGIMYGRVWNLSNSVRAVVKGGIFKGNYTIPDKYVLSEERGMSFFGSHYDVLYKTTSVYAIALNPVLEFNQKNNGISFGPYVLICKENFAGLNINLLLGHLRGKPKKNYYYLNDNE